MRSFSAWVCGPWNVKTFLLNSKKNLSRDFLIKISKKSLFSSFKVFFIRFLPFVYFLDAVRRLLMPPAHRLLLFFHSNTKGRKVFLFFRSSHLLAIRFWRDLGMGCWPANLWTFIEEMRKISLPWLDFNTHVHLAQKSQLLASSQTNNRATLSVFFQALATSTRIRRMRLKN